MSKEDIELAEEHIKLAEDIVIEEGKKSDDKKKRNFTDAAASLERAEADLEESEEE